MSSIFRKSASISILLFIAGMSAAFLFLPSVYSGMEPEDPIAHLMESSRHPSRVLEIVLQKSQDSILMMKEGIAAARELGINVSEEEYALNKIETLYKQAGKARQAGKRDVAFRHVRELLKQPVNTIIGQLELDQKLQEKIIVAVRKYRDILIKSRRIMKEKELASHQGEAVQRLELALDQAEKYYRQMKESLANNDIEDIELLIMEISNLKLKNLLDEVERKEFDEAALQNIIKNIDLEIKILSQLAAEAKTQGMESIEMARLITDLQNFYEKHKKKSQLSQKKLLRIYNEFRELDFDKRVHTMVDRCKKAGDIVQGIDETENLLTFTEKILEKQEFSTSNRGHFVSVLSRASNILSQMKDALDSKDFDVGVSLLEKIPDMELNQELRKGMKIYTKQAREELLTEGLEAAQGRLAALEGIIMQVKKKQIHIPANSSLVMNQANKLYNQALYLLIEGSCEESGVMLDQVNGLISRVKSILDDNPAIAVMFETSKNDQEKESRQLIIPPVFAGLFDESVQDRWQTIAIPEKHYFQIQQILLNESPFALQKLFAGTEPLAPLLEKVRIIPSYYRAEYLRMKGNIAEKIDMAVKKIQDRKDLQKEWLRALKRVEKSSARTDFLSDTGRKMLGQLGDFLIRISAPKFPADDVDTAVTNLENQLQKLKSEAVEESYQKGAVPFRDTRLYDWYTPFVLPLKEKGIISGVKDDTGSDTGVFESDREVTVAEGLNMAFASAGLNPSITQKSQPDPNRVITRSEFVRMLGEIHEIIVESDKDIIEAAKRLGIIDETFEPDKPLRRGDAAVILFEAMVIF